MELGHWELRRSLGRAAEDDPAQPPHARAFASWIQSAGTIREPLVSLARDAAAATGAMRQSVHVAVLGYAVTFDTSLWEAFSECVTWLAQRQHFVANRPPAFEVDGLALLGVAVGLSCDVAGTARQHRAWLASLLQRSIQSENAPGWNLSLRAAALEVLCEGKEPARPELVVEDLRVALAAKLRLMDTQASRANAWSLISGLQGESDGMTRAAAQLAALSWMLREASTLQPSSTSVNDVARLLAGVARSMRRWTWESKSRTPRSAIARWVIDNEYHVQDMLWAILAPVFPDLDDEEWLKSLGQHHPRADLALPSLHLIVEVKFARKEGKSFGDLIQEVAADASTYLQDGSSYTSIIAFIWDDAARTEEHAELRQGLLRIRGVVDAMVLPRPQKMDRSLPLTVDGSK